jgi:hypothetical protein
MSCSRDGLRLAFSVVDINPRGAHLKRLGCIAGITLLALAHSRNSQAESLKEYAAKCDQSIGITVPDFSCDAGTEVPTSINGQVIQVTSPPQTVSQCDRPNVLNRQCDPGSKFQVLVRTSDVQIVAHCRKIGKTSGKYADIAVIQYNRSNGATCFYQALADNMVDLDQAVKAPSKGLPAEGGYNWLTPMGTASIGCIGCHDNGAIVRSPYLNQITGANAIPGKDDNTYNALTQPYALIGQDFATWAAYRVEIAGNTCNGCHRMGASFIPTFMDGNMSGVSHSGTSQDLGIRATNMDQRSPFDLSVSSGKLAHSATSPIWMIPGSISYSSANATAAQAIANCAARKTENPLPNTTACKITKYTTSEPGGVTGRPGATYVQATTINSAYRQLIGRTPNDGEYLRALKFLRSGQPSANLSRIVVPRPDIMLWGGSGWNTVPIARGGQSALTVSNVFVSDDFGFAANVALAKLGDFNGDGLSDIAPIPSRNIGWNTIPVAFSNGDGGFRYVNNRYDVFSSQEQAGAISFVGDFNGDGRDDIALVNGRAGLTVIPVALSRGDGTFDFVSADGGDFARNADSSTATQFISTRFFVGDLDGNGSSDLVAIARSTSAGWNHIKVALSNGDGTFRSFTTPLPDFPAWAASGSNFGPAISIIDGDYNGDGKTDFALVGNDSWLSIPVAFSDGAGGFRVANVIDQPDFPRLSGNSFGGVFSALSGDFNNDGLTDIALVGGSGWNMVPVAFSRGDGSFRTTQGAAGTFPSSASNVTIDNRILAADFNQDGRTDLIVVGSDVPNLPAAFSNGDGTFASTTLRAVDPASGANFGAWSRRAVSSVGTGVQR